MLEDEEVQRSPWHEEVHTQAQNPGRILCDYGTPWQRLAEHDEAHLQGAVSQTRGRVLAATGTAQVYASVTRLHVLLLLPMRSHSKTQSKFLHVYTIRRHRMYRAYTKKVIDRL